MGIWPINHEQAIAGFFMVAYSWVYVFTTSKEVLRLRYLKNLHLKMGGWPKTLGDLENQPVFIAI